MAGFKLWDNHCHHRLSSRAQRRHRRRPAEPHARSLIERLENRLLLSTYMVTNKLDSGPGSLRDDVQMSNTTPGANTIMFAPGLTGTITLTSGQLTVSNDLTINGPGAASLTISGNNNGRIFQVDMGVVASISGLRLTAGAAPAGTRGADAMPSTRIPGQPGGPGGGGGALYNLGSLTLSGDAIVGNYAGAGGAGGNGYLLTLPGGAGGPGGSGGGIYSSGPLSVSGCTISNNAAGAGGPGYQTRGGTGGSGAGIYTSGPLSLSNCIISNNAAGRGGSGGYPSAGGNGGGVDGSGRLSISGCTISDNSVGSNGGQGNGGTGGGIYSIGSLTVINTNIERNGAGSGPGGGVGGGVFDDGTALLLSCAISDNGLQQNVANGAGIYNAAGSTLSLMKCTISGNLAAVNVGMGAGIYNAANGSFSLTDCTITGNTSMYARGGGIDNNGTLTASNSTFNGNNADAGGGGISNETGAAAFVVNCTVNGNQDHSSGGGGGVENAGTLTLIACTVSDNTSFSQGIGGGLLLSGGLASIYNTIVSGNHNLVRADIAGNLDYNYSTKQTEYTQSAPSSHNLISDGSGDLPLGPDGNPANGNLLGTQFAPLDPKLGPLADNGGPTQTMALLAGSPAIDAGSNALAIGTDGKPLLNDQRGYYRIFNGTVDIGAYELGSSALLPGDADADGKVDFADLVLVARNYGKTNATWFDGDFNGDGSVGFDDLLIVARNYGKSVSMTAAAVFSASQVSGVVASIGDSSGTIVKHRHTR